MSGDRITGIMTALGRYRFDVTSEKATQAAIAAALLDHNLSHEREYPLAPGDIIDFFLQERGLCALPKVASLGAREVKSLSELVRVQGIGIEVKLDGGAHDIYRQLERYCKSGKLTAILLVTNRAMGLPQEIAGVPAYYFPLGRGWL